MSQRKMIALIFLVGWTGYMAYSVFTETGLYGMLISLQNDWFGAYDPMTTGILMWIIPCTVVVLKLAPKTGQNMAGPAVLTDDENVTQEMADLARGERNVSVMGRLALICLPIAAISAGIGLSLPAEQAVPPVIDFASLSEKPPRGFVEIEGIVITDAMAGLEETIDTYTEFTVYAPIVATDATEGGTEAAPFKYFQKIQSRNTPSEGLFDRVGYLKRAALPILVRETYAEAGIIVAKETYVLDSSALDWRGTLFMIATLAGIAGFILSMLWVMYLGVLRRLRKAAAPVDPLVG